MMKIKAVVVCVMLLLSGCAASGNKEGAALQPSNDFGLKLRPMAAQLVKQNAGVHEGDLVMISGSPADQALLEDLAVEVRKVGAFPLITSSTASLTKRLGNEVPLEYVKQTPKMDLKLAGIVDVAIYVETPDFADVWAGIAPDKLQAIFNAIAPVGKLMIDRNVRQLGIGNFLYPTESRAKVLGITRAELSKLFHDAMSVDYSAVAATATKVKNTLKEGTSIHITTPNGTDLTVGTRGRKVIVSDGLMTPDKQKEGGAACQIYLPAGEVTTALEPGTANGRIVFDRLPFPDYVVFDLSLTLKDGKIVQMTGGSGFDRFKAFYDAGGPGKESMCSVDVGINPNVRLPADSKIRTFVAEGMITVGFGDDTYIGGDNQCGAGFVGWLWRATLKVDNQVLIENGQLKIK